MGERELCVLSILDEHDDVLTVLEYVSELPQVGRSRLWHRHEHLAHLGAARREELAERPHAAHAQGTRMRGTATVGIGGNDDKAYVDEPREKLKLERGPRRVPWGYPDDPLRAYQASTLGKERARRGPCTLALAALGCRGCGQDTAAGRHGELSERTALGRCDRGHGGARHLPRCAGIPPSPTRREERLLGGCDERWFAAELGGVEELNATDRVPPRGGLPDARWTGEGCRRRWTPLPGDEGELDEDRPGKPGAESRDVEAASWRARVYPACNEEDDPAERKLAERERKAPSHARLPSRCADAVTTIGPTTVRVMRSA